MPTQPFVCSICHLTIIDQYGNNAWPINESRCCDSCNGLVIVARINQMKKRQKRRNPNEVASRIAN